MNKTAIKNFAIWARNKLISDINYRAGLLGIAVDGIHSALPQSTGQTQFYDIGTAEPYAITGEQIRQRQHLVDLLRQKEKESGYKTAYKYVLEEVAYTWFNRLIAVRFMEVNDYLPSHIRVLSSESGKMEPDLVTTPFDADLEFTRDEQQTILDLKNDNKLDEVFRLLFIKQCNALNEILPALFEKTSDYTELLLNLSVIDQDGVVWHLVHDIPESDFNVEEGGQVEIIGWLYQYYNTEPKNEAFAKKGKITKDEIPAVTQLFTPDWIVRYMVENSIGRLWIEHLRALDKSADEATLAADFGWKYYLPEVVQEPEVEEKLRKLREERATLTPEKITMIDPCMGSGHILVYAFDVLMQIYENAGYGQRDAAKSILENNLFGLDIDDRAYQMAYFAVLMKARSYNRRILNGENSCNVFSIQESNEITDAALSDMGANLSEEERKVALKEIKALIVEFKDAKEYGSILSIEKRDWNLLRRFSVPQNTFGQLSLDINRTDIAAQRLQYLISIAQIMSQKYSATITNPPYFAITNGGSKLGNYVKKHYSDSKADLYAVFMEKCEQMLVNNGLQSMITMHAWMFLTSFEALRKKMEHKPIVNMIHLGARAFEDIGGEVVQTTTFVFRKTTSSAYKGVYVRLLDANSQDAKENMFLSGSNRFISSQSKYSVISGEPIAYWASDNLLQDFKEGTLLGEIATPKQGVATTDNNRFVRFWPEVGFYNIGFGYKTPEEAEKSGIKWFPFNKGGEFNKWFGNRHYVVNYQYNGREIKANVLKKYTYLKTPDFVVKNASYYFRKCISWSKISLSKVCFRYYEDGFVFSDAGMAMFVPEEKLLPLFGFVNSKVVYAVLQTIAPTTNFESGHMEKIPVLEEIFTNPNIDERVQLAIDISQEDWNSQELSWDFRRHPVLKHAGNLETAFNSLWLYMGEKHCLLKETEEQLNQIFAEIYGLSEELTPEVSEDDITVRTPDKHKDVISLLSYIVGCMLGRYSLDTDGLAYAGGYWDASKYVSFLPDEDNVIPITDEEYLEDDIVARLCTWLKVVYGEDTLEENLDYIAKALGNKGSTSREIIRNYFLNDFFKDHCQTYSVTGSGKRPIYWLFDSGKHNGFKALIYLHRYNADTIGNLRIDYLHRMQRIYESEINRMQDMIDHSTSAREAAQATKRREKLTKQLKECREYDEKLAHLALSRIELDLDDGVKVNYRKLQTASDGKFYEVLADSKNIMSKK